MVRNRHRWYLVTVVSLSLWCKPGRGFSFFPQIYFCSRTHSQLSQLVGELRKTPYADMSRQDRAVVALPMGSRKNLCINESVRKLGCLARMNDRCLDMQKKGLQ